MMRLYSRGLTTASGGNVSQRVVDGMVITPSQTDKGKMEARQIGFVDLDGKPESNDFRVSMENKMHATIYQARPDIDAIVHAHPVFATSFAINGQEIRTDLAGESRAVLGIPAFASYALMGTEALAEKVAKAALKSKVILMENHGIIALGKTLFEAYDRMEVLEAAAKMTLITNLLGRQNPLSADQLHEIDKLFE